MLKRRGGAVIALAFTGFLFGISTGATAQNRPVCGESYEISRGDSLFEIARGLYGDASEWSRIFYTNRDVLGEDPAKIFPGQVIVPPCDAPEDTPDRPDAKITERAAERAAPEPSVKPSPEPPAEPETAAKPEQAVEESARRADAPPPVSEFRPRPISFLTADDFRPFTDRSLPAGGMITELIASAMGQADIPHEMVWVNDRSAHVDPLLDRHLFDFGFPWAKPDCEDAAEQPRCRDLLYSDPVFEVLIKFFKLRGSRFDFERDADVEGRTLCRPAGHDVSDLDAEGRNWLRDRKIILIRPDSVRKCFDLLVQEKVDAVVINEFTGLEAVAQLDLSEKVDPALRAISIEPLHLVIAKRHPNASVLMFKINKALAKIRENGVYKQTVADHLALFWRDNG